MATAQQTAVAPASHRVRLEESRGDAQVLRGRHRPAADGDVVRVGQLFGAERTYCHLFFGLGDGGALAFFQFASKEDQELFGPKMPDTPFHHIALKVDADVQKAIEQRLRAAGFTEPRTFVLEHGYCRSLYAIDPDGMIVEFTVDHPDVEKINATRRADAHAELKRWLAGDHTSNNMYR